MAKNLNNPSGAKPNTRPRNGDIWDLMFNIDHLTNDQLPKRLLRKLAFLTGLITIYIYYSTVADGNIHQIAKVTAEVEEVKADYTTQKAEYMKTSKQSFLAEEVKKYGMNTSLIPPTKLVINKEIKEQ